MTKNDKYTVLVDGNFFLHKVFFTARNISKGSFNFKDDLKTDKNLLLWKLAQDFSSEVKRFEPILENIVYCIDGSSWRKHYYDHEEIESGEQIKYKANRTKSDETDWGQIYKIHSEFADALKELGVKIVRLDGCEADDLIFAWSSILNAKGKNSLIISGDNDLIQLVNHDNANGTNTLYYNKFIKSLYAYPGFTEWIKQDTIQATDIFNMPIDIHDNSKDALKNIVTSLEVTEMDTEEFQFKKILRGDSGDNVAPIHQIIKTYKSGKKAGQQYTSSISPKQIDKVYEQFSAKYPNFKEVMLWNKDVIHDACAMVKTVCKYNDVSIADLEKNFQDNRNLMILHEKSIPAPIMDSMADHVESNHLSSLDKSRINTLKDYNKVLDKTDYEKEEKKKQSSAGFFGSFDLD